MFLTTIYFKIVLALKAKAHEKERGESKEAAIRRWMDEVAAADPFPPLPGGFF